MIRDVHIQNLLNLAEQAERDAAGYRRMVQLAEQEARVGMVLPDPVGSAPAAAPWPAPQVPAGPPPYSVGTPVFDGLPSIDGSALPPNQASALGTIAAEHDAYAQTKDGAKEEQIWRKA